LPSGLTGRKLGPMLRHIVAWNYGDGFTPDENRANAAQLKAELEALVGVVPGLRSLTFYPSPWSSSSRDVVLDSVLDDAAALPGYLNHPAHLKAAANVDKYLKDRVVLDYVVD